MSILQYLICGGENLMYLNVVVAIRVMQWLLEMSTVERLLGKHLMCAMPSNANVLGKEPIRHGCSCTIGIPKGVAVGGVLRSPRPTIVGKGEAGIQYIARQMRTNTGLEAQSSSDIVEG
jgi:hypothetical protein